MAFMEPQIEQGQWYEIDTDNGTEFIPADLLNKADGLTIGQSADMADPSWETVADLIHPYCVGNPQSIKLITGWGARLSAPGYMDCTEWAVFETEQEARDYLRDELGANDEELDDTPDGWDSVETDSD
jgi:hypothetical protein